MAKVRQTHLPTANDANSEPVCLETVRDNSENGSNGVQRTITDLFEWRARQMPTSVAVEYEGHTLTYEELNLRSNQLGHYLRNLGVRLGSHVGICVERSIEMIVGVLGILKAGATYVPLDRNYPQERMSYMVEDADLEVLVGQEKLAEKVSHLGVKPVFIDSEWERIGRQAKENVDAKVTPGDPAYLVYTSGSTGRPKGVYICHRSAVRLVHNTTYANLDSTQVFLQFVSLSFDVAAFEIWGALLNGARLIVFPAHTPSADELGQWIAQSPVTTLWLTSGLFHQMVEDDTGCYFRNLHQLIAGGDVLSLSLVLKFLELYPNCRLINGYGPTENGTFSTCGELQKMPRDAASVTIGTPITDSTAYVLNHEMDAIPAGQAGELYLGGDGLALGYWKQPVMTAERFLPNPFSVTPGERLYRTGDWGRYLPDGTLEFLGRIDQQVKVRGYRIELGEIEAILQQHPKVSQAVVLAREDNPEDRRLVAYVVEHSGTHPHVAELRQYLGKTLPEYMVPSAFVFMETLPLTSNGKVDRMALAKPGRERPVLEQPYIAPSTQTEKLLARIWAEVLQVDRAGAQDHFFDLGGNSLHGGQVISKMAKSYHVQLSLRSFFENPILSDLARQFEAARQEASAADVPLLGTVPGGEEIPLGFSQERIWFIEQLDPSSIAYNFQAALRMRGPLDIQALEQSLTEIIKRHEIFRTTFMEKDGRVFQVIHEPTPAALRVIHLDHIEKDRLEEATKELIENEVTRRFDVHCLPLIRWMLLSLEEHEHVLVHVEHHLVHDGWSFNIFLGEFLSLYQAFASGQPSPLAPPRFQFADFAVWQRKYVHSKEAQAQLSYWEKKLSDSPPVSQFPTDRPRPSLGTLRGEVLRIYLPQELCMKLRSFSHQEEASLFAIMMSGFCALAYLYTQQPEFCVGTSLANRQRPETDGIIGMLVNNAVLRTQLAGGKSFRALLKEVSDLTMEAYENQDIPFQKVVQALNRTRDFNINPLFQTSFDFHNAPVSVPDIPELKLHLQEALGNGATKFDLGVIVIPSSGQRLCLNPEWDKEGVLMLWEYVADLFDGSTIERMVSHYLRVLETMILRPDDRFAGASLLDEAETRQVLVEWNQTEKAYPKCCLHELFEKQVARTPDAVAVICGSEKLTYTQLNQRANQLAHYLQERGIGPEKRAGICMERSTDMVVGMLGILKAGGAYVPVDGSYPIARVRHTVADAELTLLLTQQRVRGQLGEIEGQWISLDQAWKEISQEGTQDFESKAAFENLVYVIYTSGSTGVPKGVAVSHQALTNKICTLNGYLGISSTTTYGVLSSLSFDPILEQVFCPLCAGGTAVIMPDEVRYDSQRLIAEIERCGLSVLDVTPALASQMLSGSRGRISLDTLIIGSDVLPATLANDLREAGIARCILNLYGPTETCIDATAYEIPAGQLTGPVPIGRPLPNYRIYVLDPNLEPVLAGAKGEIYIGGAGLARGYLKRPELTAERFLPNPYGIHPGEQMYKTGDRGRYLPDGNLEFLGRKDRQVKLRGYRIELGEIEAALAAHAAVQAAAIVEVEDKLGDKRLVAFAKTRERIASSALQDYLRAALPEYMVPSQVVIQEELPTTPGGKIDQLALSQAAKQRPADAPAFVVPQSEMQQTISAIWQNILGVDKISILDNFFEIGGHSIRMLQVRSSLQDLLHRPVRLTDLFKYPTIESLARFVTDDDANPKTPAAASADRAEKLARGKAILQQRSKNVRLRPKD